MLARKLTFSFGVRVTMLLIGMVTSIVVARLVGPVVLGTFSSALAVISLFALVGNLGLNNANLRILPGSENPGSAISVFVILKGILICVMILVLGIYIYITEKYSSEGHVYIVILLICSVSAVLAEIAKVGISTFNARVERRKAEFPSVANILTGSILKITVAAAGYGAVALAYSELAGAVAFLLVALYMWRGTKFARPNMTLAGEYLFCALPLLFVSVSQGVVQNLDKVMIKYAYPGALGFTEVGIYTAGARVGAIILTLVAVVSVVFFPTFAALAKKNEIGRIRQILERYENLLVYFLMPLCILLVVFSEPVILTLLGEKYRSSAQVLQVTVVGFFIFSFSQPYINYFGAVTEKLRLIVTVYMIYAGSNFILNLVFIPESVMGVEMAGLKSFGAAIATTLSYILLGGMARALGKAQMGSARTLGRYKIEFAVLGFLTGVIAYGHVKTEDVSVLYIAVASVVYMLLYFIVCRFLCPANSSMAFESIRKIHPGLKSGSNHVHK